jgi:hypothetical protein
MSNLILILQAETMADSTSLQSTSLQKKTETLKTLPSKEFQITSLLQSLWAKFD